MGRRLIAFLMIISLLLSIASAVMLAYGPLQTRWVVFREKVVDPNKREFEVHMLVWVRAGKWYEAGVGLARFRETRDSRGTRTSSKNQGWFALPVFVIVLITGLPPLLWWGASRMNQRRKWLRTGRCCNCGYDLRASEDRCPECGEPFGIKILAEKTPPGLDADALVLRPRFKVALRFAAIMTLVFGAFVVVIGSGLMAFEHFVKPDPNLSKEIHERPVAFVAGLAGAIAPLVGLFVVAMYASQCRHCWVLDERGISLYRPWGECYWIPWRCVKKIHFLEVGVEIDTYARGALAAKLCGVSRGDVERLKAIWQRHGLSKAQ